MRQRRLTASFGTCARAVLALFFSVFLLGAIGGPASEFAQLEGEMEEAYDAYIEAVRAAIDENSSESGKGESRAKEPKADPRLAVLVKMDALAQKTAGEPAGADVALRTFYWSAGLGLDPDNLLKRFVLIVKHHPDAKDAADTIALVPDAFRATGSANQWIEGLEQIAKRNKDKETRATALFASGQILLELKDLTRAKKAFERVVAVDAEGYYAEPAKGFIREIEHLQPGMKAPDFATTTLAGERIALKDLRGKVVLLDFWATWCAPCLGEIEHLQAAAKRFKDEPFVIVGVSLDDFREMLDSIVDQYRVPGIQTWEESGRENEVAVLYNAEALPKWYLIDQDGVIRVRDSFGKELIPAVEGLLKKGKSADSGSTHH